MAGEAVSGSTRKHGWFSFFKSWSSVLYQIQIQRQGSTSEKGQRSDFCLQLYKVASYKVAGSSTEISSGASMAPR